MGVPAGSDQAGVIDGLGGQAQALLNLPNCFGLDLRAFGGVGIDRPKAVGVEHGAQNGPGLPHLFGGKRRRDRGDDGPHRLHLVQRRFAQAQNPRLHCISATPVSGPGDAFAVQAGTLQGRHEAGLGAVERHLRVGTGLHLQQAGEVFDRATHRACGGEGGKEGVGLGGIGRHQTPRGPKAIDIAERGRVAQGAHHVGAIGDWHQTGGQRCRRTP